MNNLHIQALLSLGVDWSTIHEAMVKVALLSYEVRAKNEIERRVVRLAAKSDSNPFMMNEKRAAEDVRVRMKEIPYQGPDLDELIR